MNAEKEPSSHTSWDCKTENKQKKIPTDIFLSLRFNHWCIPMPALRPFPSYTLTTPFDPLPAVQIVAPHSVDEATLPEPTYLSFHMLTSLSPKAPSFLTQGERIPKKQKTKTNFCPHPIHTSVKSLVLRSLRQEKTQKYMTKTQKKKMRHTKRFATTATLTLSHFFPPFPPPHFMVEALCALPSSHPSQQPPGLQKFLSSPPPPPPTTRCRRKRILRRPSIYHGTGQPWCVLCLPHSILLSFTLTPAFAVLPPVYV